MIYWDTSCVLKLYTAESGSALWQSAVVRTEEDFVSSVLMETEMAYALEQKEFRGELKRGGAKAVWRLFLADVKAGRFVLYPVGRDVLTMATGIAESCYRARPAVQLRTLDGLHLATALLLKCSTIATADIRMKAAAGIANMLLLQPE